MGIQTARDAVAVEFPRTLQPISPWATAIWFTLARLSFLSYIPTLAPVLSAFPSSGPAHRVGYGHVLLSYLCQGLSYRLTSGIRFGTFLYVVGSYA
jgi:hypothetical protein